MGNKRAISLLWPSAGLNRKHSFQKVEPFTTAKSLNCWSQNTFDARQTGGSRPGTGKYSQNQLGSGNKINLLSVVSWASGSGNTQVWADNFFNEGSEVDTTLWTQTSAIAATTLDKAAQGWVQVRTSNQTDSTHGAAFNNVTINTSNAYTITVPVQFFNMPSGTSSRQTIRIYARMDGTTPLPASSGMYAELQMERSSGGSYTYDGELVVNGSSVGSFTGGVSFPALNAGEFSVTINGDLVTAKWQNNQLLGAGVTIASHGAQTRTGLRMSAEGFSGATGINQYNLMRVTGFSIGTSSSSNVDVQPSIVAASNGQLYKDDGIGTFSTVGSAVLDTSENLQAVEYQQKLYIANFSLSDAGQVPKIYDPSAGTVSTWTATDGTLPARCALIARYQDRIVLGRQVGSPHLWFMSRKGDPLDWDYTELADGDNGSAISGQNSDASAIGKALTALIPFGDDYMIMACEDELWVMRGDPAFGGQIDNLSRRIGILGKFSYARTPEGGLVFLSADGIYYVGPGAQMKPESISREKIPNELLNIDQLGIAVKMDYDPEFRGVWILLRNPISGASTSFFFDWENKAFWPMKYPYAQEATMLHYASTQAVRGVLLGCADGYIRRHSTDFTSDDGTALGSYVEIGPIRIGGSEYDEGKLTELIGTPHYRLGPITYTVRAAQNAQALYNDESGAVTTTTGTWVTGSTGSALNVKDRQRIRGGACVLRLEEVDGQPWAIESIVAAIQPAGKQRVTA